MNMNIDLFSAEDFIRWYEPQTRVEELLMGVLAELPEIKKENYSLLEEISQKETDYENLEYDKDDMESDLKAEIAEKIKKIEELEDERNNLDNIVYTLQQEINDLQARE